MGVEARFYVSLIEKSAYAHNNKVTLTAVSRGDQNRQWASATPSGTVTMTINNESAAAWFEALLGKDVAVTFTAVPVLAVDDGHAYRKADVPDGHYMSGMCGDCGQRKTGHVT